MEQKSYVIQFTKIYCNHNTDDSGSNDEVYFKIKTYSDPNDPSAYSTAVEYFNSHISLDRYDSRYVDITINATSLHRIDFELWEQDDGSNVDSSKNDLVGTFTIWRNAAVAATQDHVSKITKGPADYDIYWRVISNPLPTLRILGIHCEHSSDGCNAGAITAVAGVVSQCAELAADVIGKCKTPKAIAISKACEWTSLVVERLAEVAIFVSNVFEGDDDVYLQHIDPNDASGTGGAFAPTDTAYFKMNNDETISFLDRYSKYYRFALDQGPVTIDIKEGDKLKDHVSLGSITIGEAEYFEWVDKGATVIPACNYLTRGNGQGAIYHLCYSIGMEDWAKEPTMAAQGFSAPPSDQSYPATTDVWSAWTQLPTNIITKWAPSLADMDGKLVCLSTGPDRQLVHTTTHADGSWQNWTNLGGGIADTPGAVSWGSGRLDVTVCGVAGDMWIRSCIGGSWCDWASLATSKKITSGVGLASWGSGRLDCFARGNDGQVLHRSYHNGWSGDWEDCGGGILGTPAAVSWGGNRIDVVVLGTGYDLWHLVWDGSKWQWNGAGGAKLISSPSLASRGAGTLDCVAIGTDNTLIHRVFENGAWGPWRSIPGPSGVKFMTSPAIAVVNGRRHVVAKDTDGKLWTASL